MKTSSRPWLPVGPSRLCSGSMVSLAWVAVIDTRLSVGRDCGAWRDWWLGLWMVDTGAYAREARWLWFRAYARSARTQQLKLFPCVPLIGMRASSLGERSRSGL